jgi:hypothetical protein
MGRYEKMPDQLYFCMDSAEVTKGGGGWCERCGQPGRQSGQLNKYFERNKKDLIFCDKNTLHYLNHISGISINNCGVFYVHNSCPGWLLSLLALCAKNT